MASTFYILRQRLDADLLIMHNAIPHSSAILSGNLRRTSSAVAVRCRCECCGFQCPEPAIRSGRAADPGRLHDDQLVSK